MRTDVKIGLISVFVVVVSLVGYLAYHQNKPGSTTPVAHQDKDINAPADGTRAPDDGSLSLIAPPATTSATLPDWHSTTMSATTGPATSGPASGPALTDLRGPWSTDLSTGLSTSRPALSGPLVDSHSTTTTDRILGTTDSTTSTEATTHVIVKGDTFGSLAKKYHTTIKAITKANPGVDSSHLKINQKINIPAGSTGTTGTTHVSTITPTDSDSTVTPPTTPTTRHASTPATTTHASAVPGGTYKVVKGDTLRKIAKRVYGSEKYWERIARVNRSKLHGDPSNLEVGTVLTLPPK